LQPLISIIIPTFNRASLISDTLNSVLSQTYSNWECIIVDDDSNDDTEEIVNNYLSIDNRFQFYKRPLELLKGANSCRNYGYSKSTGDYVKWFDSDDLLHSDCLKNQIESVLFHKKPIVFCEYHLFKEQSSFDTKPQHSYKNVTNIFHDFIQGSLVLNTQIALFDRNVVNQIRFDESLTRAQDLDFIFRILENNQDNVFLQNEVLVQIRAHANSITGNFHRGNVEALNSEIKVRKRIYDHVVDSSLSTTIKKKVLVNCLNSFRALLINGFYDQYKYEMNLLSTKLSFKKKFYLKVLLLIASIYNKTGRGLYFYGKISKKI